MLSEIPAKLFDEWQVYYALEPWGEERADRRMAWLTARIYNYLRGDGEQAYTIFDFMPWSDRPPPPTEEELQDKLLAAFGFTPDGQRAKDVVTSGNGQPDSG